MTSSNSTAKSPSKINGKLDASLGNVAFGAALHGWGFTLNMAKEKGVKFSDIIKAYEKGEGEKLQKRCQFTKQFLKW